MFSLFFVLFSLSADAAASCIILCFVLISVQHFVGLEF